MFDYLYETSMFPIRPEESINLMKAFTPRKMRNMVRHPSLQVPGVRIAVGSAHPSNYFTITE